MTGCWVAGGPGHAAVEMATAALEGHATPPRKQAPTSLEVHGTESSNAEFGGRPPRSGWGSLSLSSLCLPSLLVAEGEG